MRTREGGGGHHRRRIGCGLFLGAIFGRFCLPRPQASGAGARALACVHEG